MVEFLSITPAIAAMSVPDTFPLGVSRVRIQRAADLMHQFGLLKHSFNVAPMTG